MTGVSQDWTRFRDDDGSASILYSMVGDTNPVQFIGLPFMSRNAVEMLLNGEARTGGPLGYGSAAELDELRGLGLVGPGGGMTRRGAAFAHQLQCLYFEGYACVRCDTARRYLAANT